MSEEHSQPAEPKQYNYNGWTRFYHHTLRYHNATRPDSQLVSDRIETFRRFMSDRVVRDLGAFVRPHERYNTTEGWDMWVKSVQAALEPNDRSAANPVTANGWVEKFKRDEIGEQDLWEVLDTYSSEHEITYVEQRQLFWDALSWEAQERLSQRCAYFDPGHEIWNGETPDLAKSAEQKLAQIMEFSKLDTQADTKKIWVIICGTCCAFLVLASFFFIIKVRREGSDSDSWPFLIMIIFIGISVFALLGFLGLLAELSLMWDKQREYRLLEESWQPNRHSFETDQIHISY